MPPDGAAPTVALQGSFRRAPRRLHRRALARAGDGPRTAPVSSRRRSTRASPRNSPSIFTRAGVVCELSNDPIGVELAGVAKNAAALAAGATEAQGLNAAGAAAGHIFAEVWRFAEAAGARPESFIGLAGAGDLVATALAPLSRNRRAGELLAQGVAAAEIQLRVAQAVEALESVPLLAQAIERAGLAAPVTSGLSRLIDGQLPLGDWVALVRTTVPPPARWQRSRSFWERVREWLTRRRRGAPRAS